MGRADPGACVSGRKGAYHASAVQAARVESVSGMSLKTDCFRTKVMPTKKREPDNVLKTLV